MMRTYIFLLLTLFVSKAIACSCDYPDSTTIKDWIDDSDLIIEGEYLETLSTDSAMRAYENHEGIGFEVLFKVNKVLKGNTSTDVIAIIQQNSGNCGQLFRRGKQYVVFAYSVSDVNCISIRDNYKSDTIQEIPLTKIPPPPGVMENSTMIIPECNSEEQKYWNGIVNSHDTYYTSSCSTFGFNSEVHNLVKAQ